MSTPRGPADYLALGDYNAICDRCGKKFKASQLTKDWQGFMLCSRDWEPRHPQDFVRARSAAEPAPVPFVRDMPTATFVDVCMPNDRTAIPDLAIPGCLLPGFLDPANTEGF